MCHRLGQRFVAVRQMRVFTDDRDCDPAFGFVDQLDDFVPALEIGFRRLDPEMCADFAIEALGMIGGGYAVDRVDVDRRDDPALAQIAEQRDLAPRRKRNRAVTPA
jgi:hypothetical protein